jgi:hypothetical protein
MTLQPKRCELCRWWQGTDQQFIADCANPATLNSRAEYDATCSAWQAQPPQPTTTASATWEQMKLKGQQP